MYALSGSVDVVQKKLGVPITNDWDTVTRGALTVYQGAHKLTAFPMSPTGQPDPPTLVNLDYYDPLEQLNPNWAAYVDGKREKPGTFGRDLAGVSNTVPQWAWIATGIVLLGLGYFSWRQSRKKA